VSSFEVAGLNVAALLALDVDEARRWVHETMGNPAGDDEPHERLRQTLLLFFRHDGSYTATAEAMVMHKNSVKCRIASAEKVLGRRSATTARPSSSPSRPVTGWGEPCC